MAEKSRKKVGDLLGTGRANILCLSSLCPQLLCQTLLINPCFHEPPTIEPFKQSYGLLQPGFWL